MDNEAIKRELDPVIAELEEKGVSLNSTEENITGLGDLVESALAKFGITQERYKEFFNLQECGCTHRKNTTIRS